MLRHQQRRARLRLLNNDSQVAPSQGVTATNLFR